MINKQVTFDIVVTHLRAQKGVSRGIVNGRWICMYRGAEGRKCAAGCLIPDSEYDPEMEGKVVLQDTLAGKCLMAHGHDLQLVSNLQRVHDCTPPVEWEERFSVIANAYELELK